ncbi:arsenical pump-driving atpase [Stylonychia lemnae]|uniref:ATPase ASNA1 homolog n=1 Tax=Stylonychia lemnae TaxID=5949 RepID=A0A078A0K8_STYLE|nr:arsenical pump-driving atpase [Stylonychia lemnae]|eukprot:CDW74993.1 arsenical pump-driving atpase [Stylonychia lemnae]
MESAFEPTLQNIIAQKSLKWIFVGGKGGVGKTTTSSSVAVEMSKHRDNVLIISTDPAHNLSDAFDQKFTNQPTQVKGFNNLYCMEIDAQSSAEQNKFFSSLGLQGEESQGTMSFMKEFMSSVPGIDEATSFGEVLNSLDNYNFDVIIFDTAPTGHTLRLLNFPNILDKALLKMIQMKEKFGGMLNQFGTMLGGGQTNGEDFQKKLFDSLDGMKSKIVEINKQFKDPEKTTFIAVCIPEFLSLYETERLAIELAKYEIDIHNIVINQVCFPEKETPCRKCIARRKMQDKYITQIKEIYDDFHLIINPQLDEEVRGIEKLKEYGRLLFEGYVHDK